MPCICEHFSALIAASNNCLTHSLIVPRGKLLTAHSAASEKILNASDNPFMFTVSDDRVFDRLAGFAMICRTKMPNVTENYTTNQNSVRHRMRLMVSFSRPAIRSDVSKLSEEVRENAAWSR